MNPSGKSSNIFDNPHIDFEKVIHALKSQRIETPSWGYGNSGTRFNTFACAGAARNVYEKIADAAYVHKLTGIAPAVALHIPWDKTDDYTALKQYAESKGIKVGAINPNLFQDKQYKLGSLCNPSKAVRQKSIDHILACCEIMEKTGSNVLSLWLADGTNYAGQDDLFRRKENLESGLKEIYSNLPQNCRMLIEYKFFEPSFYHTDLADWGMAYVMAMKCGPRADVLVDTGHHALGTNIPHIVAFLLSEGKLGGFHFNARKYADDDLIVGTVNPFEIFDVFTKLVSAGSKADKIVYMIDQSHTIETKIEAMIMSIINCQTALAKALIVDYPALQEAQMNGDILVAQSILTKAFETDVYPLLEEVREEMGVPRDPLLAYRKDNYRNKIISERGISEANNGYPI
ncbi:MAG TPA: L-rhamnose isomerase [Candidatus Marinimicrobia bacterium]|nr:L-rhamnose isomerase [Candidatus Neomarinimicrobiota bacterium]